ncbi:hypothetical protein [Nocardia sp. NPDC052566]|uniref:phthiocerol/phthiodiolone dimycocerosyl transferase family protein n=1 Tax=Nocardia sp. NPDC052566 TaxID=3364330 RepID=UPI0037C8D1A5
MTTQRLLSPFETTFFGTATKLGSVPTAGMPLYIGTTVRGTIDAEILRRVLGELAAGHPLLRSRVLTDADGALWFQRDDAYEPALHIGEGGTAEYMKLVNSHQNWRDGLFHARLLRGGGYDRIVLVIHHGIADGRSAFALLDELWRRYTGHLAGAPLPLSNSDQRLPEAVDVQLAAVTSDAEVEEFLELVRTGALAMDPAAAPRALPRDGDGAGRDPLGRFGMERIELTEQETVGLVATARAHGLSVNSLLTGAALAAWRAQLEPVTGPLPMLAGHAVDVRYELVPRLSESTMLNCASGIGTPAEVGEDANPIELGLLAAAGVRAALDRHEASVFLLAAQRVRDELTAAIFAAQPTMAISNIGRMPAHPMPEGVTAVRDDIFAMGPGMPPKLTVFTVGGELTIQVEYDTAEHSRGQMGKVTLALVEALRDVRVA